MNVNTVNVVEYLGIALSSIRSFTEDEQGNKEAEELFSRIAKENGGVESEIKETEMQKMKRGSVCWSCGQAIKSKPEFVLVTDDNGYKTRVPICRHCNHGG